MKYEISKGLLLQLEIGQRYLFSLLLSKLIIETLNKAVRLVKRINVYK